MLNVKNAIKRTSKILSSISETPYLDAVLLLEKTLKRSRASLFSYPEMQLSVSQEKKISSYIKRHLEGEPIAYILGEQEFWSLSLNVTPDVFIPRPETEILVEWVLQNLPRDEKLCIADLGTGSGAIGLAIAAERPHWIIDASDNSQEALKIAKMNAKRYKIKNCNFYYGEWCQALIRINYHTILGNPPYISNEDQHLKQLRYEPRKALVSGSDGLSAIKIIISEAQSYLVNGGWLLLEHGFNQAEQISGLMKKAGYHDIMCYKDLADLPRMIIGRCLIPVERDRILERNS